jgi:hypothetical protein
VTANTTAIQNAIDAQNGPIVFPAGLYKCNPLTMKSGTTFIGAGNYTEGGSAPDTAVTHLNLVRIGTATTPMISIGTGVSDVSIRDMVLDGGLFTNNPNCDVVNVADSGGADQVNLRMERVTITQSGGYGLYVGTKRDDVKVHHCAILGSYKHGLLTKGPDGVYDACAFGSNGSSANQTGASGNNIEIQAVVNRVTNCDIWGGPGGTTTGTGIGIVVMPGITGIVISGNGIDRHNHQGIYVDAGCYSISIFNNVFHSNSQAVNGMYSHVFNDAGNEGGVMFDGNVATFDGTPVTATSSYLLGNSQAATTKESYVGTCNYALVGGATPGVTAGIIGWSQTN